MGEPLAKLRWRCRRGMKELDVVLLGYLERYYMQAPAKEQEAFADLLELQDPQLYAFIIGREIPTDETVANVVGKLRTAINP
jgi:antitoxin CptB